jgi:hypothetical protein
LQSLPLPVGMAPVIRRLPELLPQLGTLLLGQAAFRQSGRSALRALGLQHAPHIMAQWRLAVTAPRPFTRPRRARDWLSQHRGGHHHGDTQHRQTSRHDLHNAASLARVHVTFIRSCPGGGNFCNSMKSPPENVGFTVPGVQNRLCYKFSPKRHEPSFNPYGPDRCCR